MIAAMYLLVKHPKIIEKLRSELELVGADPSGSKIANLEHLNGVINETLRLFPPVPTAIHRKTPPEGITIDGTYLPGDMNVWCSQYILGRSETVYSQPDKFVPERWYQFPEMIKDRTAFAPFSTGPYGCIGKPLAMLNIRTTLAQLVMNFDIKFAPGGSDFVFEENAVDHFVLSFGELNLCFTERQ
ncbi:Tryprostatin B 6-hydroxylase [Lachnellula suecica]|uniref:Tryprostatin B 6-hydroxylase n=1 Tax=Lachnellula suecica TaxID=602035 RepID=A0A8T9C4Q5_9HELO|nr:Tryprostatin B 6-hydroxylase [Lachnellula suecica]